MKIILDCYGGDHGPAEMVAGAAAAQKRENGLEIILAGKREELQTLALYHGMKNYEIIDAAEVVTNDESPTAAVKTKKDSSLVRALEALKSRDDVEAMVSAGSTGAVLTGGVLKVGRLKGILRPALAPILPTLDGREVCLIDCGANVDCKPEYLAQFAMMGSSYMQTVYSIAAPRVALVSVGVEDHKGNELTKAAFQLLKEAPVNFVGNMEARDALSGNYDVLVCDGFVGNVLLKSTEGAVGMLMKSLKRSIVSRLSSKIGALFMKKSFKELKESMDYNNKGGAPFLGLSKIIVKAHGSSERVAVEAALLQASRMAAGGLVAKIKNNLPELANER